MRFRGSEKDGVLNLRREGVAVGAVGGLVYPNFELFYYIKNNNL
jgi:hypothetical protein